MSTRQLPTLAWFVAAALVWSCADIAQVSAATGGQNVLGLATMVIAIYAAMGLALGAAAILVLPRVLPAAWCTHASLCALAFAGWGLLFIAGYVNIVHLPPITEPVTIAANAAVAVGAFVLWRILARAPVADRLAASGIAAVITIVACAVVGATIGGGSSRTVHVAGVPPPPDAPNVFVVVIDSLRYDRTAAADPKSSKTPVLDDLAAEGITFDRGYTQASWTKPSVASLFTSLFPSTHRANLRRDRLSREPITMPEFFAATGYRTAVFSANPWISPAFGFDRGVHHFYESERESFTRLVILLRLLKAPDRILPERPVALALQDLETAWGVRTTRRTNCLRDVAIVEEFEEWLETDRDRPAFAYFHLMSPHIPYDPPGMQHGFSNDEQVALIQATDALPAERHDLLESLYDGAVVYADNLLGRILAKLEELEIREQSVLVVTADHGEEFHEHGRWAHGKSLYDEVIRVPLVMRGPGIDRAVRTDAPAMLIDVLPTLAAIVGGKVEPSWDGIDARQAPGDRAAYAELMREGGYEAYMVFRNGRKYVETVERLGREPRRELFDTRVDPEESRPIPLTNDAEWSELMASLRQGARDKQLAAEVVEIDDAAQERLEALGYVN